MSSVALKRVNGLSTWLVVLTAIVGVVGVVTTLLSRLAVDEARDFLAGRNGDNEAFLENEFVEAYAPSLLFGLVQGAAMIAIAVLTMIWMYRLAANHRALQRNGTWSPGWAIGGWFLPPGFLYIIPYLMFRELWKASDPTVPAGDQRWKQNRVSIVVTVWWVLYGLLPIPVAIAQGVSDFSARTFSGDNDVLAEDVAERFTISLVTALVSAAAAAAYIVLVRQLSARHRQLTGESAQPT
jgi:ABC-type Fe3+ transport system permease subunit